ncbi:cbb3-type cytochrome oxidase assembly protein CcoS [Rhodobacteraceae bacterium nBUS_24]|jgi:cbb3-type cytochrome oxidase maturation protein|nr:cbb3-type cytochrome oxidase assembly protein CcoS [Marinovum sp.]MBT4872776.1 cbb3-type cytochrome oxidase assembly protein CcoS [Marinovum sp.]MBT6506950.1 cbb3-type cytochrome oxidase assembly protein CcoS [Marinovum sp.]MBT6531969.1 cbb3-type cytochrome oxidase assembly protein CcoS [Marinovum sp.]MBT7907296.1 cbb3-type cytochrome oxidase assembly protein CcoS [Marinovum sp.]
MNILVILIPVSLILGLIGLLTFVWTVRTGQYDDVKGAAERVLIEEDLEGNSTEYSSDNKG